MSTDRPTVITEETGPRTGTIVWGVILVLLGLGTIGIGLGLRVDLQLALIVLLAVAGVGLLLKAVLPNRPSRQ